MKKTLLLACSIFIGFQAHSQVATSVPIPKEVGFDKGNKKKYFNSPNRATAIWGADAAIGTADGEMQNAFISTGSGMPYSPTSWTAQSINQSGGATTPGNAYWTHTLTGNSQGAYIGTQPPISSPTQANGSAIFDSDFMDNAGTAGNFGAGTSPTLHEGHLISPRIDASGYTDSALAVKFFCRWRNFQADVQIGLSVDDGATWTEVGIQSLLPAAVNAINEGWARAVFPNITAGVANLTQCRIRFNFYGEYYYCTIDDVTLEQAIPVDFAIALANAGGTTLTDAYHTAQPLNNRHTMLNQINDPDDLLFGANIKNVGFQAVTTSGDLDLKIDIQKDNAGTWTTVHSQLAPFDNTFTPGTNGVEIIDTLSSTAWLSTGDFRAIYSINSSLDNNALNDTIIRPFSINNNVYTSKLSTDTIGRPRRTRPIFPGGTTFTSFEYGSMFEFPNAGTDGLFVDSVTFVYYVPSGYTGSGTQSIVCAVYEWNDGSNGGFADGAMEDVELTQFGISVKTLSGLSGMDGTYASDFFDNFIDAGTGNAMDTLNDSTTYLFSLLINETLFGGGFFDSDNSIWFGAADDSEANYALNAALTSIANTVAHPSPVKAVDATGAGNWNWVGFGADIVPSIGVHFSTACNGSSADFNETTNGLTIDFTDNSSNPIAISTWAWDFGDGNTSTTQNPSHTYAGNGTYNACLTVTDTCGGTSTFCETFTICLQPIANFDTTINDLNVMFTDSSVSSGGTTAWDFGDGFFTNLQNPTYTYNTPGTYTVCLVVSDSCGSDTSCQTITVTEPSTSIDEAWFDAIKVYPIPTNELINIEGVYSHEALNLSLINALGQVVYSENILNQNVVKIDISNLSNGIYQLSFGSKSGINTKQVIIAH